MLLVIQKTISWTNQEKILENNLFRGEDILEIANLLDSFSFYITKHINLNFSVVLEFEDKNDLRERYPEYFIGN